MSKMRKRGQIVTFDLVIGIIIFVLFLGILIGTVFYFQNKDVAMEQDFEIEYIFSNFENNLEINEKTNPSTNIDFIKDYRVDKDKLTSFFVEFEDKSIDDYVMSNVEDAHGIGLSSFAYDSCLYFTDNDGSRLIINGMESVGKVKGGTCNQKIISSESPCEMYSQAISIFKPVLYDEKDVQKNRILQMSLVLCRAR